MLLSEKLPSQVQKFSVENCPNVSLAKFHTNPYNFVACLPNRYKLSICVQPRTPSQCACIGEFWTVLHQFDRPEKFFGGEVIQGE